VLFVQSGRFDIGKNGLDERRVAEQLRRNCGV
jgi:hypothetical protein